MQSPRKNVYSIGEKAAHQSAGQLRFLLTCNLQPIILPSEMDILGILLKAVHWALLQEKSCELEKILVFSMIMSPEVQTRYKWAQESNMSPLYIFVVGCLNYTNYSDKNSNKNSNSN